LLPPIENLDDPILSDDQKTIEPKITQLNQDASVFIPALQSTVDQCKTWREFIIALQCVRRLLLRTDNDKQARQLTFDLQNQLSERDYAVDYAESAQDLENALYQIHIDEKGHILKLPSHLANYISKQETSTPKYLLINWNRFDAKQMNRFKSLLDDPPMLCGLSVNKNLKIINLLNVDNNVSELFISRCDEEIF